MDVMEQLLPEKRYYFVMRLKKMIREFYKDPQNQKEFEEWEKTRDKKDR